MDRHRSGEWKSYGEMMKRTGRKGAIFTSMFIMLAIYLFAIALVIIFFYFFKFHISITIIDEYRWNKIQEVPLSLFSMDVDGQSFVSKANKVYYGFELEDEFITKTRENVNQQLFYQFLPEERPFGYWIYIFDAVIDEKPEKFKDCACDEAGENIPVMYCNDNCAGDLKGTVCGAGWEIDHEKCFHAVEQYQAEYPIPLTFDGTGKFIDKIWYNAVEYYE